MFKVFPNGEHLYECLRKPAATLRNEIMSVRGQEVPPLPRAVLEKALTEVHEDVDHSEEMISDLLNELQIADEEALLSDDLSDHDSKREVQERRQKQAEDQYVNERVRAHLNEHLRANRGRSYTSELNEEL